MATARLGQADLLLRDHDVGLACYRPHWIRQPPDRYRRVSTRARFVMRIGSHGATDLAVRSKKCRLR
jgi:hypothetical protein